MDKIAKMEIAKKGLIYIFVLIDLIIVTYLVSGFFSMLVMYNPNFFTSLNTLIPMIFVMVIFAVSVKYLVDMAIVKAEDERDTISLETKM